MASFSPDDVENYRRAAKERRPFPYETVRNWHKISEMSSHKVRRLSVNQLPSVKRGNPTPLQFLQSGSLSLDISPEDVATLIESNNPILTAWFWSLTNVSSRHPFLDDYLDEYRVRLRGMMGEDSSGTAARLYAAAQDEGGGVSSVVFPGYSH